MHHSSTESYTLSLHDALPIFIMSDRGIPKSFRHMHGFGSHTYSMINADNERVWVKFHMRSQQGIENLTDAEAAEITGHDRSEEHTSELQSRGHLVCRLLLQKK